MFDLGKLFCPTGCPKSKIYVSSGYNGVKKALSWWNQEYFVILRCGHFKRTSVYIFDLTQPLQPLNEKCQKWEVFLEKNSRRGKVVCSKNLSKSDEKWPLRPQCCPFHLTNSEGARWIAIKNKIFEIWEIHPDPSKVSEVEMGSLEVAKVKRLILSYFKSVINKPRFSFDNIFEKTVWFLKLFI